jgi:DNA-binding transcriptional regulator YhcF (GntR family)
MAEGLDLSVDRGAELPLGAQLAARIRAGVRERKLGPGDRLPSVRDVAEAAGVNVNTARAVYARLEAEGLVRSEHGRGTFVAGAAPGDDAAGDDAATRRRLRAQIAELEARLVRLPPPPLQEEEPGGGTRASRAALLSTSDLEAVRDQLRERLDELDSQRAAVLARLEQLGLEDEELGEHAPADSRRATPSLAGARIRWVGA